MQPHSARTAWGVLCASAALSYAAWAYAEPSPDELSALDALYMKRDDPATERALDRALTAALKAKPDSFPLLWRAARLKVWAGDGAQDSRLKKQLGKEAWNLGERARKSNPNAPEGHYYAGVGVGIYAQGAGILRALSEGLEGTFRERIEKAIELNVKLDRCGPLLILGRYYYDLPWPKRDLKKAVAALETCLKDFPENLRARLYLAEVWLALDKPLEARREIEKVLNGSIEYDPPEGRRIKAMAKPVAAQIEEELP